MLKILKILGGALSVLALCGGLYINSQRAAIVEKALSEAEKIATEKLGVPVKIGGVDLNGLQILHFDQMSDVTVRDIEIFDKRDELLARVEKADINFKLIALRDDPVAALDEIHIDGAMVNLTRRDDESWNVNDIKIESEGESTFGAKIFLERGTVNAAFDGKKISVEEISAEADCADMNAIAAQVTAKTLGANVKASGTVGKAQQVINAEVDKIFFANVLPLLPADTLPEDVEILGGAAHNTTLHVLRRGEALTYLGSTTVADASVRVEKTAVEQINGTVTFNEREVVIDAAATANGQYAEASGKIRLDTDETFFDIYATTDSFAPAAIISDIGIEGAASVRAHLVGTAKNPQVDAEISSDWLAYGTLSARNVSTKFRYTGDMIYLSDASADTFGGHMAGNVEIHTDDYSFNASVKASGLDAASLCDFAKVDQNINGRISADLGINGVGGNIEQIKIYGNARATALDVEGLYVNEANAAFYFREKDIIIDYLSAKIPNGGTLGLEGKITADKEIDLDFYGAHIDMAIMRNFNDALDMSGLTDFRGAVHGNIDNPNVTLELSAVDLSKASEQFTGKFFKQPFDSIQLVASGSLDGINIDKFNLEKGGKIKWTVVEGKVGLTGEKLINIQLDTDTVRAEDIAALVAPDQPITGNVTNTVKITGTLDNPQIVGNIKFNRGSYSGFLLTSMHGDYFLEGNTLRLQNFQITSPMVDMVLDGTIDKNTRAMDFVVAANDINLERFKAKLPDNYVATGHTTFEGVIKGTPSVPIFDGELKSDQIVLNGVALTNVYGHVSGNGANVYLDDLHFNDGDGTYQVQLQANLDNETMRGTVEVTDADISHMLTIADKSSDLVTGKLNSKFLLSGTFNRPTGSLTGEISQGTFAGYDIHAINIDATLINNTIYVNRLDGRQGDKGTINLSGSANLTGALDMTLTAREIALGIFTKAAGYDVDMVGTSNIDAKLGGTVDNPEGNLTLTATGGVRGSTFDLLRGQFTLQNWRVNVEELIVQRELSGKTYGARAQGFVPLKALTARSKEALPADEQLNLTVSLDGADLSLLPVMSKQVVFGVGNLDGSLTITGTAAHPLVDGRISLIDGSVKIKDLKNLIEHINIATVFHGDRFDIEKFSGNIGTGTFELSGGLSFPALEITDYNFDFAARDLDVNYKGVYRGAVNATFNFSEGTIFHWKLPKLTGRADFDRCRITVPSLPESDDPLPNIILDVTVNLGDKVHFYDSRLYDMYLTGSAHFEGTTRTPKNSGTITVKRGGTLTYLESVFNIREGEAHFNQIGSFFPTLRMLAETKIGSTRIFLSISGPPGKPTLKLTSSPEMTDTEILRLLTFRQNYSRDGGGSLSSADALAIGLQMTIISEIEDALKRSLGIDQLTVARGSGSMFESRRSEETSKQDNRDYNITIGKYINDKLMVRYTHGFGSHKVHRYGLQYDFNDNLGLTIEREGKDYIFSIEARYKF